MSAIDSSPTTWMFQYHPDSYDLASNIQNEGSLDHWSAIQSRKNMRKDQLVYIMRAGGQAGGSFARIEATGRLYSSVFADSSDRDPYKIWVHYENWIDPPLTRIEMQGDPILGKFHAFAVGRTGTNFLLPREVANRTEILVAKRLRPILTNPVQQDIPGSTRLPNDFFIGQTYRTANADLAPGERLQVQVDPGKVARANRAHADLQNRLARYLSSKGIRPLSPHAGGPNFDLAWIDGRRAYVAEVKSLTSDNEETQLRLGLAQILMYRYLLAPHCEHVQAVIVTEHEPTNPTWMDLCAELKVILVWPETVEQFL